MAEGRQRMVGEAADSPAKCVEKRGECMVQLEKFFDPGLRSGPKRQWVVREEGRDNVSHPFLFSEVTGYAIGHFLHYSMLRDKEVFVQRAQSSADWLCTDAWHENGWILTRFFFEHDLLPQHERYSFYGRRCYTFDNAIVLINLVRLYEATKTRRWYTHAQALANNLRNITDSDGAVPPVVHADTYKRLGDGTRWSQQSGSFLSKVAEALAEFSRISADGEPYREAAVKICQHTLQLQSADGSFATYKNRRELHPMMYAVEGLYRSAKILGDTRFLNASVRGTRWALNQTDERGEIAQCIDESGRPCARFRTDALAQTLRMGAKLYEEGQLDTSHWDVLRRLAARIRQLYDPTLKFFRYGYLENNALPQGQSRSYWTQAFCFEALQLYSKVNAVKKNAAVVFASVDRKRFWPMSDGRTESESRNAK
jgi:hypothetical protein